MFITTTNSAGQTTTSAPSAVTSLVTSTGTDGGVVTITQIGVNPTLSSDNGSGGTSSFFQNKGAVAGVFVLVGLAAASIILFIFFYIRRRRRTRRMEHDNAVSATLTAAGFHRAPLDDDDDNNEDGSRMQMSQHSPRSSIPSAGRLSAYMDNVEGGFNPYADVGHPMGRDDYMPVKSPSPPPGAGGGVFGNIRGNASEQRISHSASHSAGSYEPLLASFYQSQNNADSSGPPSPPPRNPQRLSDIKNQPSPTTQNSEVNDATSSLYSSESTGDDRLDPDLRRRLKDDSDSDKADLRDDEDYSRPVLGVRNVPDKVSQES